jgi:hypothetical protein
MSSAINSMGGDCQSGSWGVLADAVGDYRMRQTAPFGAHLAVGPPAESHLDFPSLGEPDARIGTCGTCGTAYSHAGGKRQS